MAFNDTHDSGNAMSNIQTSPLAAYRIPDLPRSIYYIPDVVGQPHQKKILRSLPASKWTQLSHRRLQAHPSALSSKGTLLPSRLPPYLTEIIFDRFKDLDIFVGSPHGMANHCLVNEYKPGEGIMMHEDGSAYWPVTATVSLGGSIVLEIVEKGSEDNPDDSASGDSHSNGEIVGGASDKKQRRWRILQEPGSLLITMDEAYSTTLHGIEELQVDEDLTPDTVANWDLLGDRDPIFSNGGKNIRITRTSLTYRDVIKVSNAGKAILGLGKK